MKIFSLFLLMSYYGFSQSPYGDWYGHVYAANLPLVFHIQKEDNKTTIIWDSPDQKAFGIPADISLSKGNKFKIEMEAIGMTYEGIYYPDSIFGLFVQGPIEEELTFYREKPAEKTEFRPQEPREPFDYDIEEVRFFNSVDSIYLAGTFTKPRTKEAFPAVVLVSGSGAQNRDEEIMGHKPFWVLADYLTNRGYGVLRYDDRGTFQSEGSFGGSTTFDFANDAEAAVNYLMKHEQVNADLIVVMGHSEGGMIANILGARNKDLLGIVSLAGTAIRGDSLLEIQTALINEIKTIDKEELSISKKFNREILAAITSCQSHEEVVSKLTKISKKWSKVMARKKIIQRKEMKAVIAAVNRTFSDPWMFEFVKYSPSVDIKNITCHVLVLIGSKDIQVTSTENIDGYRKLLPKNDKVQLLKEMSGLNHLFQKCESCTIKEYGTLEETFSTDALEEIRSFLDRITN